MKTLLLVRHAKSSWENFSVSDAERPLNERGKKNAPEMARRLIQRNIIIDTFLSSPAKRALTTATLFTQEFKVDSKSIVLEPELYLADKEAFTRVIKSAPDASDTIAIFSHNGGITEFANSLTAVTVDDMPTCAIFAVTADIDHWKDFASSEKTFSFFDYPKATGQSS